MTNTQLYLAIGIPSFLVLLSWFTSMWQSQRADAKIESFRTEVVTELRAVRSDINTVTRMYGEHGERLAKLER
ncbi:MAG TPA: hypothetical protein VFC39_03320 [Acidobacteriaceae bacterium]|nr:hypothetical protein [Acidobacteriaceae bacterium]